MSVTNARMAELESLAERNLMIAFLLGLLGGPLGYVYVGSWRLAVINLFTLNYLLMGFVIVPFHVVWIILSAKRKSR